MSVQSEIDRINGAKSTIAANIKDSGVSVQEGAKLEVLAPLVGDIVGQFSDELDLIIGGDTTPVTDITARLSSVNGVSGDAITQLDTLDGTKTAIHDAIVAKGVDIPEGTVFRDYAAKIGEIETGSSIKTVDVTIKSTGMTKEIGAVYIDGNGEPKETYVGGRSSQTINAASASLVVAQCVGSSPTISGNATSYETGYSSSSETAIAYVYGSCTISF